MFQRIGALVISVCAISYIYITGCGSSSSATSDDAGDVAAATAGDLSKMPNLDLSSLDPSESASANVAVAKSLKQVDLSQEGDWHTALCRADKDKEHIYMVSKELQMQLCSIAAVQQITEDADGNAIDLKLSAGEEVYISVTFPLIDPSQIDQNINLDSLCDTNPDLCSTELAKLAIGTDGSVNMAFCEDTTLHGALVLTPTGTVENPIYNGSMYMSATFQAEGGDSSSAEPIDPNEFEIEEAGFEGDEEPPDISAQAASSAPEVGVFRGLITLSDVAMSLSGDEYIIDSGAFIGRMIDNFGVGRMDVNLEASGSLVLNTGFGFKHDFGNGGQTFQGSDYVVARIGRVGSEVRGCAGQQHSMTESAWPSFNPETGEAAYSCFDICTGTETFVAQDASCTSVCTVNPVPGVIEGEIYEVKADDPGSHCQSLPSLLTSSDIDKTTLNSIVVSPVSFDCQVPTGATHVTLNPSQLGEVFGSCDQFLSEQVPQQENCFCPLCDVHYSIGDETTFPSDDPLDTDQVIFVGFSGLRDVFIDIMPSQDDSFFGDDFFKDGFIPEGAPIGEGDAPSASLTKQVPGDPPAIFSPIFCDGTASARSLSVDCFRDFGGEAFATCSGSIENRLIVSLSCVEDDGATSILSLVGTSRLDHFANDTDGKTEDVGDDFCDDNPDACGGAAAGPGDESGEDGPGGAGPDGGDEGMDGEGDFPGDDFPGEPPA